MAMDLGLRGRFALVSGGSHGIGLASAKALAGESPFVFPGRKPTKPLSNMAFEMTLRRMKVEATAHGFRSSFRDWAAETTSFSNEVAEMALAHTVKSKVEAAYRRGDLLAKRREMMNQWAGFCVGRPTPSIEGVNETDGQHD